MKGNASFKFKKAQLGEKAVLISKQIQIDFPEPFTIHVSAFIPKAELKKPMPKLAITTNVADDKIRMVAGKVEELIDYHIKVAQWLDENKEVLTAALEKESEKWLELQNAYHMAQREIKLKKVS